MHKSSVFDRVELLVPSQSRRSHFRAAVDFCLICGVRGICILRDRRGSALPLIALILPILLAITGLAFEGASWYQIRRSAQNAADAAAIAAATNASTGYAAEALAVAAQYGFQNGVNNTQIVTSNGAACPAGGNNCYSVKITRSVPLILSRLIGFRGSGTISGSSSLGEMLSATAIATQGTAPRSYCILALAGSGTTPAFRTNGAPKADLNGCDVMSNTSADCNGHNLNAGHGDAHGTSSGCGLQQTPNLPIVTDPYASLASNIPSNPCTSYPQEPAKKSGTPLPGSNLLSGSLNLTGNQTYCGDVQLTGDVTLTGSNTVLVIRNGQLDTNGYTIKTASGSTATIVYSGDNSPGYTHAPTGGGTIDITAPTSGSWSGVAMYQDPSLTSGVDISAAGNSPTWDITGLVYLPHSSVTFSGAVNKSSNGQACFGLVVDNILINGTGSILAQGQCPAAGLTLPTGQVPSRGKLVT